VLATTKLHSPGVRKGLVRRDRLVASILGAADARLTLIQAPAGSGKTTLLSEWQAASAEERPFAWLSLDSGDNDPVRFWEGVIEALRTVRPGIGERPLGLLAGPTSLTEVVLPLLVNELAELPGRVVLVLDDHHLVVNPTIHESLAFLLDHLPETVQLAIASRSEPPLPLGRLRVRREIVEIRAPELRFTDDEATALLNDTLELGLDAADILRLQGRTEGWAAGLQLAALSLAGHPDAHAFIASFAGDDRPIVDYLGFEVLDGQTEAIRDFLLRTSILERLCGAVCDAVTGGVGSAARLDEFERLGLFLVPLDTKREWYRYHNLFAELLRHELVRTRPELVASLHSKASAWYAERGLVREAIHHATEAGDVAEASRLITLHWYEYLQRGRIETVAAWLDALGDDAVRGDPSLSLTKAWIAVNTGRLEEVGQWIDTAQSGLRRRGEGNGGTVLESGVASLNEIHRYMSGDVRRAVEAGRRSVEQGKTPWRPIGCPVLGIALFWSGQPAEAAAELTDAVEQARSAGNHLAVVHASGGLAAINAEEGDLEEADRVARAALELAEERSLAEHWATTMARVVHGRALEHQGLLAEADDAIERGTELSQRGVAAMEIAYSLLSRAEARQLQGDPGGAADLAAAARTVVERCPDPGILREMLARTERRLHLASRRRAGKGDAPAGELTDRELAVLRLFPSELSQREIASTLYVSLNTVKTHARSIYRKLNVDTRDQAVARARELGVL
jgi:LuxR family transcriptional regulator, maltose regulon positive regulatory protein